MPQRDGALAVLKVLREAGHSAYFAGGCVRDLLLGRTPKDWDVATSATPEQVTQLFRRTLAIGAAFGVIKVLWRPGQEYEVATYRTEGDYSDGRRPDQVHYSTSPKEDVERRDFTLNALLLDPAPDSRRPEEAGAERHDREDGVVLDFVRGVPDLRAGLIRAVGDPHERFKEDRLRMLRAVRFAARFGFAVEPATQLAIQAHAPEIKVVSVERIVNELDGIWGSGRAALGERLLELVGLRGGLAALIPRGEESVSAAFERLDRLEGMANVFEALGDGLSSWDDRNIERVRQLVLGPESEAPTPSERTLLGWALLLKGDRKGLELAMRSLKFSRDRIDQVLCLVDLAPTLMALEAEAEPRVRRLVSRGGAMARWFQLCLLPPSHPAISRFLAMALELAERPLPDKPLVGGAELKALGVAPGPEFKRYLGAIDEAVYARQISTREEAQALLERLVKESLSES